MGDVNVLGLPGPPPGSGVQVAAGLVGICEFSLVEINIHGYPVDRDQIKLGVQAPPGVAANREEIQRQVDAGIPPRGSTSSLRALLGLSD